MDKQWSPLLLKMERVVLVEPPLNLLLYVYSAFFLSGYLLCFNDYIHTLLKVMKISLERSF